MSSSLRERPSLLHVPPPPHWLKYTLISAVTCVALILLSMEFVDRPVETWVYAHTKYWPFFKVMAAPSLLSLPLSCCYLAAFAYRKLSGRMAWPHSNLFLQICIATVVASAAKDELKWLFGRPWPLTWVTYGVYHFHPFIDDMWFGSFPSGHTTYIAAPMFVLWWLLPRYRLLWIGIVFLVMIGLVGGGYHFIADVIFGFFLGLAVAAGTVAVWPKSASRV